MSENTVEVPQWVVSKIGALSLENDILRQENNSLREYIENINSQIVDDVEDNDD